MGARFEECFVGKMLCVGVTMFSGFQRELKLSDNRHNMAVRRKTGQPQSSKHQSQTGVLFDPM